jgi:hypothetical protein
MLNLSSNIAEVLRFTDRFNSQYRFAVAGALTTSAREAAKAMPAELERPLDNPTPYTKAGFYVTPATKERLTAVVGVKDRQAEYLRWQVEGGVRVPRRKALRLPGVVGLNAYGNIPTGLIRQLVTRAKAGKRTTKAQARRFGVSQEHTLFYGDPAGERPAGIYKRERGRLVPVVVFPQQSARYEKRFDFHAAARRAVLRTFEPAIRQSWARALATAR